MKFSRKQIADGPIFNKTFAFKDVKEEQKVSWAGDLSIFVHSE